MTGTIVILPGKTLWRRMSVRRASEGQVPKASALDEYAAVVRRARCGRERVELAVAAERTQTGAGHALV